MSKLSCSTVKDLLPLFIDEVVGDETAAELRQHLRICESCSREYQAIQTEIILPTNPEVNKKTAKPLATLKKRIWAMILCCTVVAAVAVGLLLFHLNRQPDKIPWAGALSMIELNPGEEVVSEYTFTLEEASTVNYLISWSRQDVTITYGFRATDGTEYCMEVTGGSDMGSYKKVPAGTYVLFIRNSGDYSGLPAYERPENFPDVSFAATGTMLYSVG